MQQGLRSCLQKRAIVHASSFATHPDTFCLQRQIARRQIVLVTRTGRVSGGHAGRCLERLLLLPPDFPSCAGQIGIPAICGAQRARRTRLSCRLDTLEPALHPAACRHLLERTQSVFYYPPLCVLAPLREDLLRFQQNSRILRIRIRAHFTFDTEDFAHQGRGHHVFWRADHPAGAAIEQNQSGAKISHQVQVV